MVKRLPDEREAIEGAGVATATAATLLGDADLLAGAGSYGIVRSLTVLALEESVKARTLGAIALAASYGGRPGFSDDDLRKSCTAATGSGTTPASSSMSRIEEGKGWPRIEGKLVQKAEQASAADGGWLRADVCDGIWQFTPWAKAGLRAQIDEIAQAVKKVYERLSGIDGVVLSSGALFAQGEFRGESARTPDECYGLRRVLPAARVRETMIVPPTPRDASRPASGASCTTPRNPGSTGPLSRPDFRRATRSFLRNKPNRTTLYAPIRSPVRPRYYHGQRRQGSILLPERARITPIMGGWEPGRPS